MSTYYGIYGVVTKANNVYERNIYSYNETQACNIIKSDNVFGVSSNVHIDGLRCASGNSVTA